MNRNYVNALDRLTEAYETIGAHDKKPGAAWLVQTSQAHALLAIHDLLAERLPESQPRNSTPEGATWPVDGVTVAEAGEAARKAAQAVREAYSGDSDYQCPPPDEYVTILRADYDRLLDRQPAEDEAVVRRDDLAALVGGNVCAEVGCNMTSCKAKRGLRAVLDGSES